jgi:hypothetical protein
VSRETSCILCLSPADGSALDAQGFLDCRNCDLGLSPVEAPADAAGEWDRDCYGREDVVRLHLSR